MAHKLEGCRLKVAQAIEDFDAFHAEIVGFTKDNPYPLTIEDDAETGEQVIKVGEPPVLPAKWGLRVGLIAYSARSALDHLVYEIAAKAGGKPEEDKTQFPISDSREGYLRVSGRPKLSFRDRCLIGVPETIKAKIDTVQPYNKVGGPKRDPLYNLNELGNRDKHRTLSPAYGAIKTGRYVVVPAGPVDWREVEIRTKDGDVKVKAELKLEENPSRDTDVLQIQHQVDMVGQIGAEVVFQCEHRFIKLSAIHEAVHNAGAILRWLEPDFEAIERPPATDEHE